MEAGCNSCITIVNMGKEKMVPGLINPTFDRGRDKLILFKWLACLLLEVKGLEG